MMSLLVACARIASTVPIRKTVVLIALVLVAMDSAQAVEFSVGQKEVIYTTKQRKSKKLDMWPDGNLGVVTNPQGGYEFYGANGGKPAKTTGTLTAPGRSKQSVTITNLPKKTFDYVSGGPIYQDPTSGARLMIYHAETHGTSAKDFYSMLGLAVSTDASGRQFRDLGIIVQPNLPSGQAEVGGGTFAVFDDYFNVYYRDWGAEGGASELAVARAPIAELINNALSGRGTSFTKYYNGSWSEPGRGGKASSLETGNPSNLWTTVSYNDYLDQLVMVSAQWVSPQPDLYLATSPDGINWSPRQALVTDPGEQYYPTLVGTGSDPTHSGQSFYVYYTDSKKGTWNRWQDAQLVRREITLDPYSPPVGPTPPLAVTDPIAPPASSEPLPMDWAAVAEYGADFQMGGPATGWKYMWNPGGNLGNAAAFAPLKWSNSAQAYNTTGGATPTPGKKSHNDDYLTLTASSGHPGRPNYSPIAGYTIQADDGAGLYRLADTSIQKADGVLSSKEDGLAVLVYVNNTLLGPAQNVSANGLLANFDRELGQLNVGDTIWVTIDPLKTQAYDSFANFNFAIQKSVPMMIATATTQAVMQLMSVAAVPEPSTAAILLAALAGYCLRRPSRRNTSTLP